VAPYIAVNVFARGVLQRLATRIYLPGHPANDTDPLLASLKPERRATLIAETCGDELHHDFRLQGDRETVFLVW
jgi:protocatechuate 3,4-dioxygenase alpha subunit